MREYKTVQIVDLFAGRIGLRDDQVRPRADRLKKIHNGIYGILAPVQFKAGETIRLDDIPKNIRHRFEILPARHREPALSGEAGGKDKNDAKKPARL